MKILHFGFMSKISHGIRNQLIDEICAADQLKSRGVQWSTVVFSLDNPKSDSFVQKIHPTGNKVFDYLKLHYVGFQWLKKQISNYDFILFRYSPADPFSILNFNIYKNVYTIHHTLEIEELKSLFSGLMGFVVVQLESIAGRLALGRVKGVLGITPEIIDYELSRIQYRPKLLQCKYPNGVDLRKVAVAGDQRQGPPTFLMVAYHYVCWHGLDLILEKLKSCSRDFQFHIVGTVFEGDKKVIQGDHRFILHGSLNLDHIRDLACRCDFGLTSLALFRKGMTQACSLKTREYLALGLPVYSGHEDPAFPTQFPYFIFDPNLDIENLFKMALNFLAENREVIRQTAAPYIDKLKIMETLISYLGTGPDKVDDVSP